MKLCLIAGLAALCCATSLQAKDITIAHIYSKTGIFEAYGRDSQRGLELGLQYATSGTMKVKGHDLQLIESDDQRKPAMGKTFLEKAYSDDHADIAVGAISSGVTLAMARSQSSSRNCSPKAL